MLHRTLHFKNDDNSLLEPPSTAPLMVSEAQWETLKQGCMVTPAYFRLRKWATAPDTFSSQEEMLDKLQQLSERLDQLLTCLYAQGKHRLLIVLEGMDAAGKDGVARKLISGQHPMAIQMVSFKAPTAQEKARDFLWRVHAHVPKNGQCVTFDRGHYDALLRPIIDGCVKPDCIEASARQIVDFERMLFENGTHILKIYLHMSQQTQQERFRARWLDPIKRWKLTEADLESAYRYDLYLHAHEMAINQTHTDYAPWWVLPADIKGFRNLIAAELVVGVLERMGLQWPSPNSKVASSGFWKTI